jgi:ribosome-associated protein
MESKSEKKRQHHKIQELGHKLISIPEEIINEMNIGNELIDAISLAKKLKKKGALNRQKKLIGKLIKHENISHIRGVIKKTNTRSNLEKKIFKNTEFWRDRIIHKKIIGLNEYHCFIGKENPSIKIKLKAIEQNTKKDSGTKLKRELFKIIFEELSNLSD